jgi:hypothetical protein
MRASAHRTTFQPAPRSAFNSATCPRRRQQQRQSIDAESRQAEGYEATFQNAQSRKAGEALKIHDFWMLWSTGHSSSHSGSFSAAHSLIMRKIMPPTL